MRRGCIAIGLVLLSITIYCLKQFSRPDGNYDCPRVAVTGFSYLSFNAGRVELITPEFRKPFGTYAKENGCWIWTSIHGEKWSLRPTLANLRVFDQNGNEVDGSPLGRLMLRPR
jgi:hypothetical protein